MKEKWLKEIVLKTFPKTINNLSWTIKNLSWTIKNISGLIETLPKAIEIQDIVRPGNLRDFPVIQLTRFYSISIDFISIN
jgi:hypothetical protein